MGSQNTVREIFTPEFGIYRLRRDIPFPSTVLIENLLGISRADHIHQQEEQENLEAQLAPGERETSPADSPLVRAVASLITDGPLMTGSSPAIAIDFRSAIVRRIFSVLNRNETRQPFPFIKLILNEDFVSIELFEGVSVLDFNGSPNLLEFLSLKADWLPAELPADVSDEHIELRVNLFEIEFILF